MKKKLAVLSAALMGVTLLSGCGAGSYSTRLPDYSDYVTLGSYENLEYVPQVTEITDEDVQAELDSFVEGLSTEKEITDRGAEIGDNINVDYVGSVDGVEFEGGSTGGEGTDLILGESGYIDGFDDQMVGMKVGETKDINVTFPDPYENNPDLAGKDAVFVTTMNSISVTETPELTDQLVVDNTDCDTIDAYKEQIRTSLKADAAEEDADADTDSLLSAAAANATFSAYPEDEIKSLIDDTIAQIKSQASSFGLDYATFIMYFYGSETEEDFETYLADSAKEYMRQRMVACAIAREEKIKVTEDEIKEYVNTLMEEYELESTEEVYESYTDEDLEYMLLVEKVGELLKKTAVQVEPTTEEVTDSEDSDTGEDTGDEDAATGEETEGENTTAGEDTGSADTATEEETEDEAALSDTLEETETETSVDTSSEE